MATTWEVQSTTNNTTTATCKVDGTAVATITGLKEGLTVSGGSITGIEIDDSNGIIKLDTRVLGTSNVAINSKKYVLGFSGYVSGMNGIEIESSDVSPKMSVTNGTVKVTGTLKEGYTLNSKKTGITYSAEKTGAELATISGLNVSLVEGTDDNAGKIGVNTTTGEGDAAVTTFTEAVKLNGNTITLTQDALKDGSVTLKYVKGSPATYTLALDGVIAPQISGEGTWAVTNKGVATYTDTISKGHTLSLDGKTVNFTAAQEGKVLAKITGVNKDADVDDDFSIENVTGDSRYAAKITLSDGALTTGNVTVSAGYQLALNAGVSQNPEATNDIWAVNKTTATYKQVTPAYYSYDTTNNKITYNKQADIQTYATVTGLKSGLKVSGDGKSLDYVTNSETEEGVVSFNEATEKQIDLKSNALTTTNVAVTGTGYTLALDDVDAPETENEVWSVSGTTATLKGNITAGYTQTSDTAITYVKAATNVKSPATLATIKGLDKGLSVSAKNEANNTVGTIDENGDFVSGLAKDSESGVITLSDNVLGSTNVTLTPAAGFNYTLAPDSDADSEAGTVITKNNVTRNFFVINGSSVEFKDGKAAYYTLATDGKTLSYNAPVPNSSALVSIKGLKTTLKADSDYNIDGITYDNKKFTLSKDVLDEKNVTLSKTGYSFLLKDGVSKPEEVSLWSIDNKIAYLKSYDSAGYTLTDSNKVITYSDQAFKKDLAEISGLKNGVKVNNDGTITGITVDENENKIELAKSVLGTTDVELTNSNGNSYSLALASDVANGETLGSWDSRNTKNGKAVYKVTTPAGFVLDSENNKAVYNKKSSATVTISGLDSEVAVDNGKVDGIIPDLTAGTFTLSDSVLNEKPVTITGGDYKLALDSVTAPEFTAGKWTTETKKNVTTATLNGTVETPGYQLSADGKTVNYFQETDEDDETPAPESVVLATITGLNGNVAANTDGTITGITSDNKKVPTKFTLSKEVLGTSKVAVSGGSYTLALDSEVPQEVEEDVLAWVTSGTTATYKKFDKGFYTLDDTKSSINYTADTKGTTYATLKGFVSGTDINGYYNTSTKTVTLNADQLSTSKVTLTGTGYKLALGTAPTSAVPTTGWVTSGTTATYKNYTPGYYKLSGNTINYTAATKGTTIATIKGIKSGAEITAGANKEVELSADQLGTSKVTISGDGYTLKLADGVQKAESTGKEWNTTEVKNRQGDVTSVTAAYVENISKGYALDAKATTITYSAAEKSNTLATIKGLASDASLDDDDDGKGTGSEISGISVASTKNDSGKYEITLSNPSILGNRVTLASTDYVLAMDGENVAAPAEEEDSRVWVIGMKNNKPTGTATYKTLISEGYTLSADGKTLSKVAADDNKTLLTLSGLNTTALAELEFCDGNTYSGDLTGITVNDENQAVTFSTEDYITKKVTLGKNDPYTFVLDGVKEPTAYTNPKWSVSTVKGTTKAVLKDGMEEGYTLANGNKTIVLTAEKAGDTVATLNGLVKGLKVSDDKQSLYFTNSDGTASPAVSYTKSNTKISLLAPSLGTSDITLESDTYTIGTMGGVAPKLNDPAWTFNNGTATYAQVQEKGYTLTNNKTVNYTAPKTTTIATITGLDKTFSGTVGEYLGVNDKHVVTVSKGILGTSKVAISVPKNSTAYTLDLASNVPQQAEAKTAQWVTSGTTVQYKDYNDAYYLLGTGNKAITYVKPKDVKVYATIKGLASGTTINSTSFSGNTSGGTITLTDDMLGASNVSLSVLKGTNFALALDSEVKTAAEEETIGWYNEGSKATYGKYINSYYEAKAAGNGITYKKGKVNEAYATVTGTTGKITAEPDSGTFTLNGDQLSQKITLDGKVGNGDYAFDFTNYSDATINGSKKADNITASGDRLSISTGDDADTINISGAYVTVTAGAGDDTIDASDSDGHNVFVFSKNQGADVIKGFHSTDSITASGVKTAERGGDNIIIKFGTGTITLEDVANLNSIILNGKVVTPTEVSSENLLADDNYSMDAAQLSSIVNADLKSYTPYDFSSNFSLTKEESFIPEITYSKDK